MHPYVLYGVKYINLVSLVHFAGLIDSKAKREAITGQSLRKYKPKSFAGNIWIRDVVCYRIKAPLVLGVPIKTRLESSIKNFTPHFIYDWVSARIAEAAKKCAKDEQPCVMPTLKGCLRGFNINPSNPKLPIKNA